MTRGCSVSASEKLRALGERANGPQTYGPEPQEWEESAASVMDALPQIVAVVEAAENYFENGDPSGGPDYDTGEYRTLEALADALAALDEKLGGTAA